MKRTPPDVFDLAGMRPAAAYLRLVDDPDSVSALIGHAAISMFDTYESKGARFAPKDFAAKTMRGQSYGGASHSCGFTFGAMNGIAAFAESVTGPIDGLVNAVVKELYPDDHHLFKTDRLNDDGSISRLGMSSKNALLHPYVAAMIGLGSQGHAAKARLDVRLLAIEKLGGAKLELSALTGFEYCCKRNMPGMRTELDEMVKSVLSIAPDERKPKDMKAYIAAFFCSREEFTDPDRFSSSRSQHRLAFLAYQPDLAHIFGPEVPEVPLASQIRNIVDTHRPMTQESVEAAIEDQIGVDAWQRVKADPVGYFIDSDYESPHPL